MISKKYIKQFMVEFENKKQISTTYWKQIAAEILDDVVKELNNNVTNEDDWDENDVMNAIGVVLCERLGI